MVRIFFHSPLLSDFSLLMLAVTAGMSVHAPHERAALLDLVESFQWRLGWPADSLRKELEAEYQKDELSAFSG